MLPGILAPESPITSHTEGDSIHAHLCHTQPTDSSSATYQSLPMGVSQCTLMKRWIHQQRNMWNKPKHPQTGNNAKGMSISCMGASPFCWHLALRKERGVGREVGEGGGRGREKREGRYHQDNIPFARDTC